MAVAKAIRLQVGNRRQMAMAEFIKEISSVFDMCLALHRVAHDGGGVLEGIADVAIPVTAGADQHINGIDS